MGTRNIILKREPSIKEGSFYATKETKYEKGRGNNNVSGHLVVLIDVLDR
ncbi:hypothetical protein [Bacillus phage SP8]|nr:hypothetical protein [Bacillus phage SP8]